MYIDTTKELALTLAKSEPKQSNLSVSTKMNGLFFLESLLMHDYFHQPQYYIFLYSHAKPSYRFVLEATGVVLASLTMFMTSFILWKQNFVFSSLTPSVNSSGKFLKNHGCDLISFMVILWNIIINQSYNIRLVL